MARNLWPVSGTGPPKFGKGGCSLIAMTTALVSLYSLSLVYPSTDYNVLVLPSRKTTSVEQQSEQRRPVAWLERQEENSRRPLAENELIDLTDFAYVLEPRRSCWTDDHQHGRPLYFIVYVHSAPEHFQERQIIRSTWGSLRDTEFGMRLVFMLGLDTDELQSKIVEEHLLYDDVVQGNFADTYRNLTYKHLMGYKWATSRCPLATLIVKADDDAFVDLIQLRQVLTELYGTGASSSGVRIRDALACSVWPAESSPQRDDGAKWAVSYTDYPYSAYPAYCGGLAYVVSPDVAVDLLATSRRVPFFWIDDVYVTGLLVEALSDGPRRQALNLRTTYDTSALIKWLRSSGAKSRPCPYVFGDVSGSGDNRARIMHRLWQKTIDFWRKEERGRSSPPPLPTPTPTSMVPSAAPDTHTT